VSSTAVAEAPAERIEGDAAGPLRGALASRRWVLRPVGVYLATRVAVLAAAGVAAEISGTPFGRLFNLWDASWYLTLAEHGYPSRVSPLSGPPGQTTLGFFPLHPLATRLVHGLGVSWEAASLLVANAASLAAVVLLWRLLRRCSGSSAADRGVALWCFFPGSLFLSMGYAEPLMMVCVIACLGALLDRRWIAAGLMAGLATATRPSGIAIVAPCVWAAAVAVRRRRDWRALAAPLLSLSGIAAFFTYLEIHTGEAGAYLRTQERAWDQHRDMFAAFRSVATFVHRPFADDNFTLALAGMLFVALAAWPFLRRRPPGIFVAYTAAALFVAFANRTGTDLTTTKPRALLVAFPLITALGDDLPPAVYSAVLAGMAALLGAFTIVTLAGQFTTP
jgi:hypothetical protein